MGQFLTSTNPGLQHDAALSLFLPDEGCARCDQLQELLDTDALTGVRSRSAFEAEALARLDRPDTTLIIADLDDFKLFNDRYGHEAGDMALVHFCQVVSQLLGPSDVLARLGGEEFAILLDSRTSERSRAKAEEIRAAVEETPVAFDGLLLPFTVSLGVRRRQGSSDRPNLSAWLRDADGRLFSAKRQGRNCVVDSGGITSLDSRPAASFETLHDEGPKMVVEMQAATQMLRLIMDHIPQTIFWKDRDSRYLGCNQNFADLAGLEAPADIVGTTDFDHPWAGDDAEGFVEYDQRIMDSGEAEVGIIEQVPTADGKVLWVETNKIPLRSTTGEVIGILGTFQDVTAKMLANATTLPEVD